MTASPGQIALRKFDHDEARDRHAKGEGIAPLAREYGVAWAAVARVVDERVRRKMHAQSLANLERRRMPCRGGCGVLVWQHGPRRTGYCPQCLGEKRNVVNHGTESEYRDGCRCPLCTQAASEAKRQRRLRARVPCSHGCGTMVEGNNRRDMTKPPECLPCALKRIHSSAGA